MFDFQARYAFVERIACRVALSNYTAGAMRDAPRHARAGIGIRVATVEPATDDFAVYRGKSSEVHTRKAFPSSSRHNSGSGTGVGRIASWRKVARGLLTRRARPLASLFFAHSRMIPCLLLLPTSPLQPPPLSLPRALGAETAYSAPWTSASKKNSFTGCTSSPPASTGSTMATRRSTEDSPSGSPLSAL